MHTKSKSEEAKLPTNFNIRETSESQEEKKSSPKSKSKIFLSFRSLISSLARKRRPNYSKRVKGILMRWLEDHIDNPYPTENEREELCSQTGLSRRQLRVWFIDTRRVSSCFYPIEETRENSVQKQKEICTENRPY